MARTLRKSNRRRIRKQGRDVVLIRKPTAQPRRRSAMARQGGGRAIQIAPRFARCSRTTARARSTRRPSGAPTQRCLIAPADLDDVKPTTADKVEDADGTVFAVMHVGEFKPGTESFRYELQLRA